jgi:hypothetical protein
MATPLNDTTYAMSRYLSGASQRQFANVDGESRDVIWERYETDCIDSPDIRDAYASQGKPPVFLERASSLACKVEALTGGRNFVDRATQSGDASIYCHQAQHQMAVGRLNCEVVGLIPLLQQIPAAQECLEIVAQMGSDNDKYKVMETWIQENPAEVASLSELTVVHCKASKVQRFVRPIFYPVGSKVYNLIPTQIRYFTGLRKMILDNNYIAGFPAEFANLHLEHLSLQANHLKKLPPPISSLKTLHLDRNQGRFAKVEIEAFIRGYVQNGGQGIQIFLDPEHIDDYSPLADEIGATHELQVSLKDGQAVFSISKKLEATQPLED